MDLFERLKALSTRLKGRRTFLCVLGVIGSVLAYRAGLIELANAQMWVATFGAGAIAALRAAQPAQPTPKS